MANEIRTSAGLTYNKNGVTETINNQVNINVTGNGFIKRTIGLTTVDATLDLGNITTPGVCYFQNLDSTNTIQIGGDGTDYPVQLLPGEDGRFRFNAAAIHAKAVAGTPLLHYVVIDT